MFSAMASSNWGKKKPISRAAIPNITAKVSFQDIFSLPRLRGVVHCKV